MSRIISLDHEIVQLPDTVGMLWVYQTSQRNWVTIKDTTGISESVCWVNTDRDWDLSLRMTERYLWAHSVMHHHIELKVTKWFVTGSCIMVRVKWLAGNETERAIGIPTIESRASNVPIDKEGNWVRDWLGPRHRGSSDEIIEEHVGANMGIQIPLLVIDRRSSRSCLHVSRTRRVYTLKVRWR